MLVPRLLNKVSSQARMNEWGGRSIPFFFAIDFDCHQCFVEPLETLHKFGIQFTSPSTSSFSTDHDGVSTKKSLIFDKDLMSLAAYRSYFDQVQHHLKQGDTYLFNLTFSTPVQCNLSLHELFIRSQAKYKILFADDWLCFSPETFVQIDEKGIISSFPMKGTRVQSNENSNQELQNSQKEKAEQATIVDLIRNDMSRVALQVEVPRFCFINSIRGGDSPLLQLSSEVKGRIEGHCWQSRIGDILFALLPAGSITGAPKQKTIELIQQIETHQRGFYTGVAGVFDGTRLDSCVLIRFMEKRANHLCYKSGGGITAQSILEEEYQEYIQKIYVPLVY